MDEVVIHWYGVSELRCWAAGVALCDEGRVYGLMAWFVLSRREHGFFFFFFNDTATTEIYTLSLHDALPIFRSFRGLLCKTSHSSLSSCPHSGESKLPDKRGHSDVTGLKYRKYNIIEYTFKFNEMKYNSEPVFVLTWYNIKVFPLRHGTSGGSCDLFVWVSIMWLLLLTICSGVPSSSFPYSGKVERFQQIMFVTPTQDMQRSDHKYHHPDS